MSRIIGTGQAIVVQAEGSSSATSAAVAASCQAFYDPFSRVSAGGWGTAPAPYAQPWVTQPHAGVAYSCDGGSAIATLTAVQAGGGGTMTLNAPPWPSDGLVIARSFDMTGTFEIDSATTTQQGVNMSVYLGLIPADSTLPRPWTTAINFSLNVWNAGFQELTIDYVATNGASNNVAASPTTLLVINTLYAYRMRVDSGALFAGLRYWPLSSEEPSTWDASLVMPGPWLQNTTAAGFGKTFFLDGFHNTAATSTFVFTYVRLECI